jgi:hypothetical protein
MKLKLALIAGLVVAASGCVSIPDTTAEAPVFKGGATPDYRQLPGMTWVARDIAVKSRCEVSSIRKQGNVIYLDC